MSEKILFIDGHSMLTRAFYGLPDLTTPDGRHTGAVLGFLNTLLKALEEEEPSYLAVAFDEHAPTFRHELFKEYKGTRKPMPEELREQVPLMKEILAAMNIPIITMAGYEADDILGTLGRRCEKEGMEVTILTGDRDLLQLCTEHLKIRMPKIVKGQNIVELYYAKDVLEKYQVTPTQFIDLKGLMGDASDNIPGLPGVGEKTATKILLTFGSIENAYEHVEEVKPNKAKETLREHIELARLSKTLATINTNAPVSLDMEAARRGDLGTEAAMALFSDLGFKSLLAKLSSGKKAPSAPAANWQLTFFEVADAEGVSSLLAKASSLPFVGASLLGEKGRFFGAAVALSGEEVYFLPGGEGFDGEIFSLLASLSEGKGLCTMDAKAILSFAKIPEDTFLYDAGIGAYLLNPLKGSYPYEDVSVLYLEGRGQPGREELLGKKGLVAAPYEAIKEVAAREAATALLGREAIWKALQEQGLDKVYEEIELPLIYTLSSMEKWGIRCLGEELSRYGKEIAGRISALEASIYEKAGEEFNLNSPKQ
ncbi:MAG: DNA polymerase I, partial [Blautia sp.]|nr:DNA polymerase I [Blautia sp.]